MTDRARIGIIVVAYNAASTLTSVLDRIPTDFRPRITEVLVCDDHSTDETYDVGVSYKNRSPDLPLTIVRHPRNLGYGGNQKAAYRLAAERGLNIVVLLHGDGQYAPEVLPEIVAPLEAGLCDAVMGSRMLESGAARGGGMPLYKFVGNRILTSFENHMLDMDLSEFHSGYRAYSVEALNALPLDRNSDGFSFDTQIIIQLQDAGRRIIEIPIPTYYGDEICYVNGMRYAREVAAETARYRLGRMGFGTGPNCLPARQLAHEPYDLKTSANSSHEKLLSLFADLAPVRVLDLGCSSGLLSERVRKLGHEVVGIDIENHDGIQARVDTFVQADLDRGIPPEVGTGFDVVLAADVVEHVRDPRKLLREVRDRLSDRGVVLACVPNFGHWYPRIRTALGRFDYDQRGILDEGHVRFFTRRSFERLARSAGFEVRRHIATGLPVEVFGAGAARGIWPIIARIDEFAANLRPDLFAYQLIFELVPSPNGNVKP